MRAAAAGFDFTHDATGDVIAREKFGRPARILVTLAIAPAFLLVVRSLGFVSVGNVAEHEALAFAVEQDAAFAAHALGHENSHDARRPNHACGMELDELHIDEFGARVISEGM